MALLLPVFEVFTATLLLVSATWWASIAAQVLLSIFTIVIVVNLARGKRPDCHCFGQLHAKPIGVSTLVRNGGLLGLSTILLFVRQSPNFSFSSGFAFLFKEHLLGTVLVGGIGFFMAGQSWLSLHLLRQNGRLLLRIESLESTSEMKATHKIKAPLGLQPGSQAPNFELLSLNGKLVSLDSLRSAAKPVLLLFSDPNCGTCKAMLPDVSRWSREYENQMSVVLLSRGDEKANKRYIGAHGINYVLRQHDYEVSSAYQAWGTPSAVVVGADGIIHSSVASGSEAIAELVKKLVSGTLSVPKTATKPLALARGSAVPKFSLADLKGRIWTLDDFSGQSVLLVFWNPSCGFCERMLPDLRLWENKRLSIEPRLVLISSSSPNANQALELDATVLLDNSHQTMAAFGAGGTPSGLLIDGKGRVASELAMGASAIFALVTDIKMKPPESVMPPHLLKARPATLPKSSQAHAND